MNMRLSYGRNGVASGERPGVLSLLKARRREMPNFQYQLPQE
jgi:hypothetical protein